METIKMQVQKEILALLDDSIDDEIEMMEGHYTIAEISREVLLQVNQGGLKL